MLMAALLRGPFDSDADVFCFEGVRVVECLSRGARNAEPHHRKGTVLLCKHLLRRTVTKPWNSVLHLVVARDGPGSIEFWA